MKNVRLLGCLLAVGLTVIAPVAEARGGARTPSGTGTVSRQGTATTGRVPGGAQRQYQGTRTGTQGNTSTVERTTNVNKTGKGTYTRDTQQTVTGPGGQQRSWEAQGSGTVQKTESGFQKTYQGTVTNDKGYTTDVQRTTDVTKNADGSVTRDTDATYTKENGQSRSVDRNSTSTRNDDGTITTERDSIHTNGQGEILGTGESTTVRTPGQESQSNGSYTNSQGKTWNYEGQNTRTEPGTVQHSQTITQPNGQQRTSTGTARWQWVDGKWVRMGSGQSTPVSETPNP
jgi:hypothetical protein